MAWVTGACSVTEGLWLLGKCHDHWFVRRGLYNITWLKMTLNNDIQLKFWHHVWQLSICLPFSLSIVKEMRAQIWGLVVVFEPGFRGVVCGLLHAACPCVLWTTVGLPEPRSKQLCFPSHVPGLWGPTAACLLQLLWVPRHYSLFLSHSSARRHAARVPPLPSCTLGPARGERKHPHFNPEWEAE